MHIGHNRPLFCLSVLWMLAVGAACAPAGTGWLWWVASICLLFGLCAAVAAVVAWRSRGRLRSARCLPTVAAILLCVGVSLCNAGYCFEGQVTPASFPGVQVEQTAEISTASEEGETPDLPSAADAPVWQVRAVVAERLSGGSQITGYGLILRSVGETAVDGGRYTVRAYLLCSYAANLQPGYEILLTAQATELEVAAEDMAQSLRGDGYSLGLLSADETDCVVVDRHTDDLSVRLGNLRRRLAAGLEASVGQEGQGLPSALLLGDRSELAPSLRRDFSRSGVSHLLAISGLHMTLLFGMLALLLRLLRVPRRGQALLLGLSALGYLLLLGFPPSATRAVIMLGMVYLSWLCTASADPLTSLGLAGALILGVSPYAVLDAGFWMSFSATLGMLVAADAMRTDGSSAPRPLTYLVSALKGLLSGLVAMTFSLWITSLAIGNVSLWSPLATLLLTPLCGVVLAVSLLCLPLGGQWVGERLLLPVLRWVCDLMTDMTALMAEPTRAVVSFRQPRTETAIAVTIGFMTAWILIWIFIKLPKRRRALGLLPLAVGWVAVLLLAELPARISDEEILTTYIHATPSSEALILTRGHEAVICDIGDGSRTSLNAATREAEDAGATEVAVLMLTHYHTRTAGSLWRVLAATTVRELWLPRPTTADDYYRMLACLREAARQEVPVMLYDPGERLTVFADSAEAGVELTLCTGKLSRSVQPVILVQVSGKRDCTVTFCGGGVFESELTETAATWVADSHAVIYGAHPPSLRQGYGYTSSDRVEWLVFADETAAAWFDPDSLPNDEPPRMGMGRFQTMLYGK